MTDRQITICLAAAPGGHLSELLNLRTAYERLADSVGILRHTTRWGAPTWLTCSRPSSRPGCGAGGGGREALGEAGRAGTGRYGVDQDAFGGEGSFTHVE
jgi:hypothetical protein